MRKVGGVKVLVVVKDKEEADGMEDSPITILKEMQRINS